MGMRVPVLMLVTVVRSCVLCLVCGVRMDNFCSMIAVICLGWLC
jgi:hypothetical protein